MHSNTLVTRLEKTRKVAKAKAQLSENNLFADDDYFANRCKQCNHKDYCFDKGVCKK